ncbi:hypothetical protein [Sphingomonas sp. KR3-1]|uniref:hypothetical protein n=1 Tax=Sphingomonas sp. KR3-1 TaxID=3156611 RepID=UPI0032B49B0C
MNDNRVITMPSTICALTIEDIDLVDGGSSVTEAFMAGVAGMSAARTVAALAGASSGGTGAAVVLVGGFAVGVALYYITD